MSKGKLIVTGTSIILGIGIIAGFLGIEKVDGPQGSVCFKARETEQPVP